MSELPSTKPLLPRPFNGDRFVDPNVIGLDLSEYSKNLTHDLHTPNGVTLDKARRLLETAIIVTRNSELKIPICEVGYLLACSAFIIDNLKQMRKITEDELKKFVDFGANCIEESLK